MKAEIQLNRRMRRRGMALVYVAVCAVVLMAFLGLAVDLARAEAAKTELRRAADSAARAACDVLLSTGSQSNAIAAAGDIMRNTQVDGVYMTPGTGSTSMFNTSLSTSNNATDIIFGTWNATNHTFTASTSSPNAVQVYARRITSRGTALNLMFTSFLGRNTVDVWTYATAAAVSVSSLDPNDTVAPQTVQANYNPWLAGAPEFNPEASSHVGTIASAPEETTSDYNNTQGTTQKPNSQLYQDSNSQQKADHPYEYDLAGPVGGTIPGTANSSGVLDESESPLQVLTTSGADMPLQSGDIIQINVPASYVNSQGDVVQNLVTNVNTAGTTPNTQADGTVTGTDTTSPIYQDVGAIPPTNTTTFNEYASYAGNPTPAYTGNPSSATQTNLTDNDVIAGTENNLTNIAVPINSMIGVFLGGTDGQAPVAQGANTPPGYDFSTQTNRDYASLQPAVQQVFYAGNGSAGGTQQSIVVPNGATRLFLGTMDGQEWANNTGQFGGITITQLRVILVQ